MSDKKAGQKTRRVIALRYVLPVMAVAALCVVLYLVFMQDGQHSVYPQQEIAAGHFACVMMDKHQEAYSSAYVSNWLGRDQYVEQLKTKRASREDIEYVLGPAEIDENTTLERTTRVVVPLLSAKYRDKSTGETVVLGGPDGQELTATILERHYTFDGPTWRIVSDLRKSEIYTSPDWRKSPRKQLPDSPTITLRKEGDSVVMQAVLRGEIVSEKTILRSNWSKVQGM